MKEYKIAKGWAIFIYIAAFLMIALFGWVLLMPLIPGMEKELSMDTYWFIALISIAMISLAIIGLLDTIKGKFVIDKNKVYIVSTLSNRELLFNEIKGYIITQKFIFIEPIDETKKRIKISNYFAKTNEIKEWLYSNYSNLDLVQKEKEKNEILSNQEFGSTKEQREEKLKLAHKVAKITNGAGALVAAWTLFFPNPYEYAIITCALLPFIAIIILKYFNGLIRIDERRDTAYPTIFWAIFSPSLAVCLRALLDFNIFDYSNIWIPSLLITLCYIGILLFRNSELHFTKTRDFFSSLVFVILMFGYSYGIVVSLNCIYDKSEPELFNATVLSKRVSSGKTKTYYIKLTPWGKQTETDDVTVSRDLYDILDTNDEVNIYFMQGKFEIPWFEITK